MPSPDELDPPAHVGPAADGPATGGVPDGVRQLALVLAVSRYVIPLAAIPLIPVLLRDHLPLLILLRPTKELLLLGGGRAQVTGDPTILVLFAAYVPLMMLLVVPFFVLGRAYRAKLELGEGPTWLHRAIPPEQFAIAQRVLARRGPSIAILGRIAAIPPTILAAAAGASSVGARRYLVADAIGGLAAFAITVGAGYGLGQAYAEGGVWLTAAGVALFVVLVALLSRWIRRETRPLAQP
jgi:membrane protein DedA with SNARE-associated domain